MKTVSKYDKIKICIKITKGKSIEIIKFSFKDKVEI